MSSTATIDGQTITVASTGTTVSQNGLLSQPTNIGTLRPGQTGHATEVGIKLKRAMGNRMNFTVGYTFLYLSDVLRAGDQIDTNINVSQISPGTLSGGALPRIWLPVNRLLGTRIEPWNRRLLLTCVKFEPTRKDKPAAADLIRVVRSSRATIVQPTCRVESYENCRVL